MSAITKSYSELLRDPRWQRRRLEVLEKCDFACEKCGDTNKTLHVHHLIYRRGYKPWEYEDQDLQCLCEECHKTATERLERINEQVALLSFLWDDEVVQGLLVAFSSEAELPGWEIAIPSNRFAVGVALAWRVDSEDVISEAKLNNNRISGDTLSRLAMHKWTGIFKQMWADVGIDITRPQSRHSDSGRS